MKKPQVALGLLVEPRRNTIAATVNESLYFAGKPSLPIAKSWYLSYAPPWTELIRESSRTALRGTEILESNTSFALHSIEL